MAEDWQVEQAKKLIGWPYLDTEPIRLALTAGDSESQDREGNRRLAQCGDKLIPFIVTMICFQMNISRQNENATQIMIQSKQECSQRAQICQLDKFVKISGRQACKGPQPTVLKNTMFALVAAVWMQAQDWSATVITMENLGLLCRRSEFVSPDELIMLGSPTSLLDAVMPYRARISDEPATTISHNEEALMSDAVGNSLTRPNGSAILPTELMPIFSSSTLMAEYRHLSDTGTWPDTVAAPLPQRLSGLTGSPPGLHTDSGNNNYLQCDRCSSGRPCTERITQDESHTSNEPYTTMVDVTDSSQPTVVDDPSGNSESAGRGMSHISNTVTSDRASKNRAILMQMVRYIGSGSAIHSLKLVVMNLRVVRLNHDGKANAIRIGARRSQDDRVSAIHDLTTSLAHFTLALRMHIYMLYKEAESKQNDQSNVDGSFVMESGQSTNRQRGNPYHIRKASISRRMGSHGQRSEVIKRWRRMGHRLDLLVRAYGRGILAILDEKLTVDMLLKFREPVFEDFIQILERSNGEMLRLMCDRARPIVDMLFEDDESTVTFQVETVDVRMLRDQESCSPLLADMLLPRANDSLSDHE